MSRTSPDVYVHRIGRTGRVGRTGRAITFFEARQQREVEAIEAHSGVKLAPWVKDAARRGDCRRRPRPKRHSKPHDAERDVVELPLRKLIIAGGRADGIEPKDVVHALTKAGDLDGEAVRNVRVLERFSFAEVPEQDADRVVAGGGRDRGRRTPAAPRARSRPDVSVRVAARWPLPRTPRQLRVSAACSRDLCIRVFVDRTTDNLEGNACVKPSSVLRSSARRLAPPVAGAMAVALVALFVALSGGAYAAVTIPAHSVGATQLKSFAVTNPKLGVNSVGSRKIMPGRRRLLPGQQAARFSCA